MANLTSFKAGDIIDSTVMIGDNNLSVSHIKLGAGAKLTINQADKRPNYWPKAGRVTKLPSPITRLFGREQELSQLRQARQAGKPVSLWSADGMGKSAIIRQLTHTLDSEEPSINIVYFDAEQKWGIEDVQQAMFDLFIETKQNYVPSAVTRPNALSTVKALVVVDNLRVSVKDSESLVNSAPGCAFVLISNDRLLAADAPSIALAGLSGESARELFSMQYGPLSADDEAAFDQLAMRLQGSPDELLRIAERGHLQGKSVAQLLAELGDAADEQAVVQAAIIPLDDTGRRLLAFLAVAGESTIPLAALQIAFPGVDVAQEMEKVKKFLLAQSHSPRYSLRGTLPASLAKLWDLTGWEATLFDTSLTWLERQTDPDAVVEAYGMLMQALTNAAARQRWSDVLRLGRAMEPWLIVSRRWQAWSDVLNLILRAAENLGDRMTEGWALHQLGSRALFQGSLEPARSFLTRALDIRQAIGDRPGLEVTRNNLDVLKALGAPPRSNGHGGNGGGRPLSYSFFGFAGLLALGAAAYILTHRPPPTPEPPPPVVTTAAPVTPPSIAPVTHEPSVTPSLTPTLTQTPTDTPTITITPPPVPFTAIVISPDLLNCHYGPGKAYEVEWALSPKDEVLVIGRADTFVGPYVLVQYRSPFGKSPALPCWVDPGYLDLLGGDIYALPQPYPDKAPLIQFTDPKYVPYVFPPPMKVDAYRKGNEVDISWYGKNLADGDR
ncbi:MAG: hypothetical protein ACM3MF_09765, partial [Anaerolineae bacterium]